MNKVLRLFLTLVLFCGFQNYASQTHVYVSQEEAAADYSDIIYHHNLDALGTATKSGGSSTVNFDAGILLETTTTKVGSGCADQNNDGFDDYDMAISGNFDMSSGRLGLWVYFNELQDGVMVQSVGGQFRCRYAASTSRLELNWLGGTDFWTHSGTLTTGTWYFFEFRFNGTNCTLYIDGGATATRSTTGSGSFTDTQMSFMAQDGNAWDMFQDNIIASNDVDRDLYAIAEVTDFS